MQSPDEIQVAEGNYLAVWKLLASRFSDGLVEESDDSLLTYLPDSASFFNSLFVKAHADVIDCLERARAFFSPRQTQFTLRFRDSDERRSVCESAGLTLAGTSPLMNAVVDQLVEPESSLDIRPATRESWDDHVRTIAGGFGLPLRLAERVFPVSLAEEPDYAGFIVFVDGKAASTAALVVADRVAGIYNVATPEPYRQRGLGEAATRAAIAEGARRGCAVATLQASEMGLPIYERMGFRTVSRWASGTN